MRVQFSLSCVLIYKYYPHKVLAWVPEKVHADIYFDADENCTVIDTTFITNGRTAQIKLEPFIAVLAYLKGKGDFKSLKFMGHYEKTAEEVYQLVLNEYNKNLAQ